MNKTGLATEDLWCIGTELNQSDYWGNNEVHVYTPEIVHGPFVFTGVGLDLVTGFLFQIASHVNKRSEKERSSNPTSFRSKIELLMEDSFYDQKTWLASAEKIDYVWASQDYAPVVFDRKGSEASR